MRKIFIDDCGELNFIRGKLANSYDLMESVAIGNEPILGVIELEDGHFSWFSNIEDIGVTEEIGEICEYIKLPDTMFSFTEKTTNEEIKEIKEIKVKIENANSDFEIIKRHKYLIACSIVSIIALHVFIEFCKCDIINCITHIMHIGYV